MPWKTLLLPLLSIWKVWQSSSIQLQSSEHNWSPSSQAWKEVLCLWLELPSLCGVYLKCYFCLQCPQCQINILQCFPMSSQILAAAQLSLTWRLMSCSALILNVTQDILRNVQCWGFFSFIRSLNPTSHRMMNWNTLEKQRDKGARSLATIRQSQHHDNFTPPLTGERDINKFPVQIRKPHLGEDSIDRL